MRFIEIENSNGYFINENSEIIRKERIFVQKNGVSVRKKQFTLRHSKSTGGYLLASINYNGKEKKQFVHRLIAQAFIPNPESKPFINHINGIKTDNRIENLEWCTTSENAIHSFVFLGRKSSSLNTMNGTNSKKIGLYNSKNELITEYPSSAEASRSLGKGDTGARVIANAARLGISGYGYFWKKL